MIYGYHLLICLFLIILQTTLLAIGSMVHLYDLLAPFVVYLGVFHLPRVAIPVIAFSGLAMDGISGGVFGVHLTAYLWMYVGVRWVIQFLQAGNVILLPLLVTAGVFFESLLVAFSAVVLTSAPWPVETVFPVVSGQVLWGAVTGPFLMLAFVRGQKVVDRARKSFYSEKGPLGTP
jgi:cell shape-determining protein MreD